MVTGMAATAIEMDGVHPDAFNLETLENVAVFQFLQTLIHFVPALSKYRGPLKQFSIDHLQKVTRPKDFQSKVHPLRTNSCNEMNVQEMKEAVNDFAAQLGISEETINGRCWPFSGDGKTFDVLLRIRKLLSPEESTFESFRWMVPMLEIWHTKWTNMSGVVRDHYGDYTDPSSLASQAKTAGCPPIPNLRKVDFYEGQHLINVVLDANVLKVVGNTTTPPTSSTTLLSAKIALIPVVMETSKTRWRRRQTKQPRGWKRRRRGSCPRSRTLWALPSV